MVTVSLTNCLIAFILTVVNYSHVNNSIKEIKNDLLDYTPRWKDDFGRSVDGVRQVYLLNVEDLTTDSEQIAKRYKSILKQD